MKFAEPYLLYLLWGVALIAGIMIYGNRKRMRVLSRFAGSKAREVLLPDFSVSRPWYRTVIITVSMVFIVIALAGPQWGFRWETVEQKGVDIMICLDCSRSMLAQDIKPTRLERAKREIIDLLRMIRSDRAGLVAFAGGAILQCPLTLDHSAFNIFLQALDPDYLPVGGTDLSGAIETALNGFETDVDSEKAIILITDGEDTAGSEPFEAAKKAAGQGVKIFCIGVGSEDGAPVPDKDGGFKKDASGNIILSKVADQGLRDIAAAGSGIYVRSVAGDMDLDRIYNQEIRNTMEAKTLTSGRKKVWEHRFQWFLLPGILLLMIELLMGDRKKTSRNLFLMILAAGLVSFSTGTCRAGASASVRDGIKAFSEGRYEEAEKHFIDAQLARPEMAELYYNIGTAAYKNEDFDQAEKQFKRAMDTDDTVLKNKARYNLANTAFRQGKLEKAEELYQQAIEADPEDRQSKENLEFVKKKIEEKKKQEQEKQQQKEKDQQQGDNKDSDNSGQDPGSQEKGNQEQEQQKKEDAGDKDKGQKSTEQPQKSQQPGQEPNTQAGTDKKPQAGAGEEQPDHPETGNKEQQDQTAARAQEGQKEESGDSGPTGQSRLLNRLKDEPGKALFPVYQERKIQKDW